MQVPLHGLGLRKSYPCQTHVKPITSKGAKFSLGVIPNVMARFHVLAIAVGHLHSTMFRLFAGTGGGLEKPVV